MRRTILKPGRKPSEAPFCSAIECDNWLYISGQGPLDENGKYVAGTIEEETLHTLKEIEAILQAAGYEKKDVVKCTCYLANLDDFAGFTKTFGAFFEGHKPTRTTVGAPLLRGIRIEIDAVAFKER